MAKRVLNRREMRKAADAAEQNEIASETAAEPAVKAPRAKAAPKTKKPRKKKEPARMCARWGVFDAAMKQVAVFDYNQRHEADAKMADLMSKKKTPYFLQIVKEPMPEPAEATA